MILNHASAEVKTVFIGILYLPMIIACVLQGQGLKATYKYFIKYEVACH